MHIEILAERLGFTEGPVLLPDGRLACTSISHGCVYFVGTVGGAVERIDTGGGANGLAVGPDGALYVAQNGGIFGASGRAEPGVQVIRGERVEYLAEGMGAPNDLVFGPDGRLWVTDTRGEIDPGKPGDGLPGRVWAVDISSGAKELVIDEGPVFVNGLAFSLDGRRLILTVTLAAKLLSYEPSGSGPPELIHKFDTGWPDGIAVNSRGEVWVALTAGDRLDAIAPDGERAATVALPAGSLPTNVCLAGDDALVVTAAHSQSLLRIRLS
jgi:gluconolactonase